MLDVDNIVSELRSVWLKPEFKPNVMEKAATLIEEMTEEIQNLKRMVSHANDVAEAYKAKGEAMSNIEAGEIFQTRSGNFVRILCNNRKSFVFPVVGLINDEILCLYRLDGTVDIDEHPNDIMFYDWNEHMDYISENSDRTFSDGDQLLLAAEEGYLYNEYMNSKTRGLK